LTSSKKTHKKQKKTKKQNNKKKKKKKPKKKKKKKKKKPTQTKKKKKKRGRCRSRKYHEGRNASLRQRLKTISGESEKLVLWVGPIITKEGALGKEKGKSIVTQTNIRRGKTPRPSGKRRDHWER